MDYGLTALAFAVVGGSSRAFFIWLNRGWFAQGFGGDASVHLAIIRQFARDPRSDWVEQYLISPEPMSYPTGFHRYASLWKLDTLIRRPWLPSLLLFTVGSGLFGIYCVYVAERVLDLPARSFSITAGAVFFFSISNITFDGPAISYLGLSERLMGRLATGFFVLLVTVGVAFGDPASLWLSAGAGCLALISSIFARQVLLFFGPLMALAWWDARPMLAVAISFALAFLLSRHRFVRGMKHTILTWKLYATHTKRSRILSQWLSHLVRPSELRGAISRPAALGKLLLSREPTRALLRYPETFVFPLLLLLDSSGRPLRGALVTVAVALGVYLATSTRWLNHLGEAYRYIEYGLYALVPVLAATWFTTAAPDDSLGLALAYAAWVLVVGIPLAILGRRRRGRDELSEAITKAGLDGEIVVFPVDMRLGADLCARRASIKSFWWQPGIISTLIYDDFIEEYPYLKRDFGGLFRHFGVTHVVASRAALAACPFAYDFGRLIPQHADELLVVYRVGALDTSPQL